jgi:serine/threonine-protein kinase
VLATPVMTDDAGATMPVSPARLAGSRSTGTMARVGNPRRRRASNWALITLTLLGLLAVASLAAGLYIATRPNTAAVPQLAGLSPNQAEQALHRIGLNGSAQQVAGSDCTVGQVFGPTSPAVGTQARKGSTVSYQVCAGPGQATIPNNLIRMDKAAALQALNALHLQVDFLTTDSTLAKDLVANSDPVPGTTVPVGTVVKVYLSLADMALVPDVRGKAAVDATDALHKAGFVDVKIKNDNNITPAQVGLVTNMVPSPSTTTPHLFTETIVIYVGALESSPSPSPSS